MCQQLFVLTFRRYRHMKLKNEMSIAVVFLAASIIFVSSTLLENNVFAQTEGEMAMSESMSESNNTNYENFLNCLSDASGKNSVPAGDQIVNCLVESGYVQGSSSMSNDVDKEEESRNQVNVAGDETEQKETENIKVGVVGDEDEDDDEDDDEE